MNSSMVVDSQSRAENISILSRPKKPSHAALSGEQPLQGISVTVFSVTSWSELAREGQACTQRMPADKRSESVPFISRMLHESRGPIVAATDYVRAVPDSVRAFVPDGREYFTLGTDGFGRSDTRAALRAFFGVDAASIAQAAHLLLAQG